MTYLVLTQPSEAYAASISALMWGITRPAAAPGDVTSYLVAWGVHPVTDEVALVMPGDEVPVHVDADADALVAAVEAALLPGEADTLRSAIEAAKGDTVDPASLVPVSAQARTLTRDAAAVAGWIE